MVDVRRHSQFVEWMAAVVDPNSDEYLGDDGGAIRQAINKLIRMLEVSDEPPPMPHGKQLSGTRFDLYELRWPPLERGAGPRAGSGDPVIRVLYGYVRPICDPTMGEVAVILLGGNKSPAADAWYDAAVPEAERRLEDWCDEYLAFVPRERDD